MADDGRKDAWAMGGDEPELRKPVLLTTCSDEMEAGVVQSLLASCGIPSRRRNVGMGAFMGVVLGSNRFGIEIDVAEEDLDTATRLLTAAPVDDGTEPVPEDPEEGEEPETDGRADDAEDAADPDRDVVEALYGPEDEDGKPDAGDPSTGRPTFVVLVVVLLLVLAGLALVILRALGKA